MKKRSEGQYIGKLDGYDKIKLKLNKKRIKFILNRIKLINRINIIKII